MRKRLAILGSTGSIGRQTLDVVRRLPDRLQVTALAANSRGDQLKAQAAEFGVKHLALMDAEAAGASDVPAGIEAITELATRDDVDVVVVAVAGVIGLQPTLAGIRAGKQIALASKEVLVAAGEVVMREARERKVAITPIDSEHSAIFQCLQGAEPKSIRRLFLTASGGPFRGRSRRELSQVTTAQALAHPTWSMGGKITVDSATLMNKGLEMIEAQWLFDTPLALIEVVVHPQSVIHSMVEFSDTSVIAQLGWPDMRLPIQYALLYPDRVASNLEPWSPVKSGNLTFEAPDHDTFPALRLARRAGEAGGTVPCAFNAGNEEAANAFLRGECGFLQITDVVEEVVVRHRPGHPDLDHLLETDRWARETTRRLLGLS